MTKPVAEIMQSAHARAAQAKAAIAVKKKAEIDWQLRLELWPEEVRGVPNVILRGALFGVSQDRIIHKNRTLIAIVKGYEIRFKGAWMMNDELRAGRCHRPVTRRR